jgi:hypothetical protein
MSMPCPAIGQPNLYLIRSVDKIAFCDHVSLVCEMLAQAHVHQCTCFTNYFVILLVSEIIGGIDKIGLMGRLS